MPDAARYILHLDDEALILRIVGDALTQRGHLVRSATSLREADRLVQSERPALLICDLHLADGDGILAIKALRTRWPGLPVMLLTGSVGDSRQASDFAGLVDAFVPKPCSLAHLTEEVEHLLAS